MQTSASIQSLGHGVPKRYLLVRTEARQQAVRLFQHSLKVLLLPVMDRLWLETTEVTINAIKSVDKLRIVKDVSVTSACAKHKRKSCDIGTAQKVKRHKRELTEGPTCDAWQTTLGHLPNPYFPCSSHLYSNDHYRSFY